MIKTKMLKRRMLSRYFHAENEHEVGLGIKDSGVPREEIFLTSKLWNTHQPNVAEGLEKSLKALGTDYLDLYVCVLPIRWPLRHVTLASG